jgi:hypothetical protein
VTVLRVTADGIEDHFVSLPSTSLGSRRMGDHSAPSAGVQSR